MPKTNTMDQVLTFPRPAERRLEAGADMINRANRTFICAVLFVDIVDYSKKPVSQQLRIKERFNTCLSATLQDIAANDRIILDTGDGAAINFLGDLEDALFVAISLAQSFTKPADEDFAIDVRIGINLGPVQLVRDINGQLNIIGDGINVAERVMSFAGSGQVLVSRWYFEAVTRISEDYTHLFTYQGSRTDKHVREHEIYAVASMGAEALDVATRRQRARPTSRPPLKLIDTKDATPSTPQGWRQPARLPYAAAALSCLALVCAVVYYVSERAASSASTAARFAPAIRLAEPPAPPPVQAHAAAEGTQSDAANAPLPAPTEPAASETTRSNPHRARVIAKKPATTPKVVSTATSAPETPTAVPPALKAPAPPALEPTVAPPVSPWRPYHEEQKVPSGTQASNPSAALSPHTAAPPKPATALVMLAVSPWGEVLVDGKSAGVSPPLSELELEPGSHRIEIRNGDFPPHLVTLQLESNQTLKIKHKFTQR